MPHFIVEYSANIHNEMKLDELLQQLHRAALSTGIFALAAIRVRAKKRDHYIVADGDPRNAFVHVDAHIGQGRSTELRQQVGRQLFAAICDHLSAACGDRPLAISFELHEIDSDFSLRRNNLHERLAAKKTGDDGPNPKFQ
ncbi:MAG: 5-carboxymethyl-2-hydroxymuconate Delta-isomerase [Steroidobacteraceae bacterium]